MCVRIGSKQNTGVSKANSASSHIWLKLSSESILNCWRENRNASMDWLGFFLLYTSGQKFGFIWNNNLLLKKLFWFLSMLKTVAAEYIFRILWWTEISKEQPLFEIEIFCNIIFTFPFKLSKCQCYSFHSIMKQHNRMQHWSYQGRRFNVDIGGGKRAIIAQSLIWKPHYNRHFHN